MLNYFARAALVLAALLWMSASQACPEFLSPEYRVLHSTKTTSACSDGARAYLVVNTASHCGFTPQFKGLEALYQRYKDHGLQVVGFASNDFKQESKNEAEAAGICYLNYGVTFTMFAPSHVKGAEANATFKVLNAKTEAPSWNFNKYLVSADGSRVQHFGSRTTPEDEQLKQAIEAMLQN